MSNAQEHLGAEEARPKRSPYGPWLWLVGLCVLAGVIWFVGWKQVRDELRAANLTFVAGAIALDAGAIWVRAVKWRYVIGPGSNAVYLHFLSKLAGNYSPGRVGELSPLLFRRHRNARIGAWIVTDRLLEAGTTLTVGAIGILFLRSPQAGGVPALLFAIAVLASAPFMLALASGPLARMADRWTQRPWLARAITVLANVGVEIRLLRTKAPAAAFMTIASAGLELAALIVLYRSFGVPVPIPLVAAARCAQSLVGAIPVTPGPTGAPQVAAGAFMIRFGGIAQGIVAAAMILREVAANALMWLSFWCATAFFRNKDV